MSSPEKIDMWRDSPPESDLGKHPDIWTREENEGIMLPEALKYLPTADRVPGANSQPISGGYGQPMPLGYYEQGPSPYNVERTLWDDVKRLIYGYDPIN